jgi:hypothetical protein
VSRLFLICFEGAGARVVAFGCGRAGGDGRCRPGIALSSEDALQSREHPAMRRGVALYPRMRSGVALDALVRHTLHLTSAGEG